MSLAFNDTASKQGIIQMIERRCKLGDAYISGNTARLKEWTARVNNWMDKSWALVFKSSGKWQFDDSNHTDYPFITTNLVASQRDYTFTTDESGNLILDVYKVMVKDPQGIYQELYPIDQQSDEGTHSFFDGRNEEGTPERYDKTANGILLDLIPDYSVTAGLKVFINREGSYFTYTDTTKKPGFAGLFHSYPAIGPSFEYAVDNGLANKNDLKQELLETEMGIKKHYRDRSKDERLFISPETICSQ